MTTQPPLVIPELIPRRASRAIPDRLVAAIRWDYEYELLSAAQCVERYSTLLGNHAVYDICAGRIYPDVKASRMKLLWR